jgi:hypothetical protein
MKNYLTFIFILLFFSSCSKGDNNPLIIPPNYSELPNSNDLKKTQENVGNQENLDKLKESLQKNNNF